MTVRQLIYRLIEHNLDAEVWVEFPTTQVDKELDYNQFHVVGVPVEKGKMHLVLAAEDLEYEG